MVDLSNMFSAMLTLVLVPVCIIAGIVMLICGLGWWSGLPLLISIALIFIIYILEELS